MVVVPAGGYTMGSPAGEEGRAAAEGPQNAVTFAKAFAVGKYAVTFEEWEACVVGGGCNSYRPGGGEGRPSGRYPVVNVSWDDAEAYVAWLAKSTGKAYRLLSEAEREYVTRAGTTTPFWWGPSISTEQANYDGSVTYGGGKRGEYRQKSLPVDSFARRSGQRRGPRKVAVVASCVADPGTTVRNCSGRLPASDSIPATAPTRSGSGSPGRSEAQIPRAPAFAAA
jgi:formylglycine-generating enzyme required for sulfatase activity